MPSTSKKQHNFMEAVANNPSFAKKAGVPQSVGKDFAAADKGVSFKGGPRERPDLQKVNKPKTLQGKTELFKQGGRTMANTSRMNRLEELGRVNAEKAYTPKGKANLAAEKKRVVSEVKMAKGGMAASGMGKVRTAAPSRDGIAEKGKTKGMMPKMAGNQGLKKGGMAKAKK